MFKNTYSIKTGIIRIVYTDKLKKKKKKSLNILLFWPHSPITPGILFVLVTSVLHWTARTSKFSLTCSSNSSMVTDNLFLLSNHTTSMWRKTRSALLTRWRKISQVTAFNNSEAPVSLQGKEEKKTGSLRVKGKDWCRITSITACRITSSSSPSH